jgi:uncharacterized protein (DUF4415 family)
VGKRDASSQPDAPTAKSEGNIVRYSLLDLPPDKTDWARVEALTDEEIEAAIADDPDAAPIADEGFWARARVVLPPPKEPISIRIDKDVLAWFRSLGRGYQTRINAVLRAYMEARKKAGG